MSNARVVIPHSPAEADFHRHWQSAVARSEGNEIDLALAGGGVADRLAWVFVSGYQAALRRCFPEVAGAGWTCLAVAEPEDSPACTIDADGRGFRLNGAKSWIAGVESIESLVVSVGTDSERCFARVEADARGVELTQPRSPSFLRELSQGAARFHNTPVNGEQVFAEPERAQWFRGAEPLYVLIALNGCLLAHANFLGDTGLARLATTAVDLGRPLSACLGDKTRIVPGLRSLRAATTAALESAARYLDRFPAPLRESWAADARLFTMFGVKVSDAGGAGSRRQ